MSSPGLEELVREGFPELEPAQVTRILCFHGILAAENERQNLTRLISPRDFFEGHLVDVMELRKTGWIRDGAMDLGSGCGVPGLLASLIDNQPWILCESEGNKARFLEAAAKECGADARIRVVAERAEAFLGRGERVEQVVARAVGPVLRLMTWIGACSTWNTMILFKGPGWEEEWKDLEGSKYRGKVRIAAMHRYEVGEEKKSRVLVRLERVPRGTRS